MGAFFGVGHLVSFSVFAMFYEESSERSNSAVLYNSKSSEECPLVELRSNLSCGIWETNLTTVTLNRGFELEGVNDCEARGVVVEWKSMVNELQTTYRLKLKSTQRPDCSHESHIADARRRSCASVRYIWSLGLGDRGISRRIALNLQ